MKLVVNPPTPCPNWQATVSTRKTRPTIMGRAVEGKPDREETHDPPPQHERHEVRGGAYVGACWLGRKTRSAFFTPILASVFFYAFFYACFYVGIPLDRGWGALMDKRHPDFTPFLSRSLRVFYSDHRQRVFNAFLRVFSFPRS